MYAPILINHIRNPPPLIHNLTPSIPIEKLTAQLTRAQIPRPAVRIRAILEDLRHLLPFPETFLESEKMPIHALAVAGIADVFHMRVDRLAEKLDAFFGRDARVSHCVAESYAFGGDGTACFGAALLEAAGGRRFIGRTVEVVHLVVGELDDHLDVGVGGCFEFLDEVFAVALVGLNAEIVLGDKGVKVFSGAVDF